ncbi:IS200/IS605 family accessory protein TnpB-related protein [Streptomyces pimonensis]|uniref:IS200/IS605 family accessory protein TnpB-related protein n=1 Tax=Streptomyces pimonensis TaxID=2860288 RepID=UPI0035296899
MRTIAHRLSLLVGEKVTKRAPGGYRTQREWFAKTRRLHLLEGRLAAERTDREAGRVRVVQGGKRLARNRQHLEQAQLTEDVWRQRWEAARWFLRAGGESGKRFGNETIRGTPDGEVSIKLLVPFAHLADSGRDRYVLTGTVAFRHRDEKWADRVSADRAVACRIRLDTGRGRWYLTASWTIPPARTVPLAQARTGGLVGVGADTDHLAAWCLDEYGNPVGEPRRFSHDLSGSAAHRDAQVRHALIRLLHWAVRHRLAIAIENLDFQTETTRERHVRRKRFHRLISGMPVSRLRARLASMAAELGITVVAVDPAYTPRWCAQRWQKPLTAEARKTSRHDAAAVAIGRLALGHRIRRRTAPPPAHQSDGQGHRTAQASYGGRGREGTHPRIPGPRTRSASPAPRAKAGDQHARHCSGHATEHGSWCQDLLPLSL